MRIIAIVATFFLLFAVSASSQQGESTGDTTHAFLLSAADVAAHAARLDTTDCVAMIEASR